MNMIQFHVGSMIQRKMFKELGKIKKLSGDCFEIQVVFDNDITFRYYLDPTYYRLDNTPDFLMFDEKIYSEMELYTFCTNWITENILNVLEADNE